MQRCSPNSLAGKEILGFTRKNSHCLQVKSNICRDHTAQKTLDKEAVIPLRDETFFRQCLLQPLLKWCCMPTHFLILKIKRTSDMTLANEGCRNTYKAISQTSLYLLVEFGIPFPSHHLGEIRVGSSSFQ